MFFFFNDTATTEIYTLSLHDALPISVSCQTEPCVSQRMTPRMKSAVGPSGAPSIVSLPNDKSRKDSVMNRRKLIALSAVFPTAAAALLLPSPTVPPSARNKTEEHTP